MNRFNNQLFLVTGASSGIGRSIALKLNEMGATVLANGRNIERLEETIKLAQFPGKIKPVARDLAEDMAGIPKWLAQLAAENGKLRGLVCSAGITYNAPMSFYDIAKARQIFDICCHSPLKLGSAFCGRRVNAGAGSAIVFIAAAAALDPNPGQGMYAAAKAALVGGARCMAKEAAPHKIRVNCISPGLVDSPMMEATVKQLGDGFLAREIGQYPLGIGTPADVAELAIFLLSDRSRWLTGQNIPLTGGR